MRYFEVKSLEGFGAFSRVETAACGAVLAYVERTQINERPALSRPVRETTGTVMFIDGATRANLEMVRTLSGERRGSLLAAIDRTVTGGGSRLLAERMMNPLNDPQMISTRLDGVSWFCGNQTISDLLRDQLKSCPDIPRALSRLALNRGGPRDLGAILQGVKTAGEIGVALGRTQSELPKEIARASDALTNFDPQLGQGSRFNSGCGIAAVET